MDLIYSPHSVRQIVV